MISDPLRDKSTQKTCPNCGANFTCGPVAGEKDCWCDKVPHISPVGDHECLCQTCLKELIASKELSQSSVVQASTLGNEMSQPPLIEGVDYYSEESAIVFTAAYHLRRGYCCESNCRHCPYIGTSTGSGGRTIRSV